MGAEQDAVISLRKRFQDALKTKFLGRNLRWLASIPSTNDDARRWAERDAPHGALVVADHQTAGRGRQGRIWTTRAGLNLTISLVLRPAIPASEYGLVTLAASVAARGAVAEHAVGRKVEIKWPNDILIGRAKCCGMLLESAIQADADASYVVLGIGMNVNQTVFPDELQGRATSLMLETGQRLDRAALLADLLSSLEAAFDEMEKRPDDLIRSYERHLCGLGGRLVLRDAHSDADRRGLFVGIDRYGALMLDPGDGVLTFHAGDVHVIGEES